MFIDFLFKAKIKKVGAFLGMVWFVRINEIRSLEEKTLRTEFNEKSPK